MLKRQLLFSLFMLMSFGFTAAVNAQDIPEDEVELSDLAPTTGGGNWAPVATSKTAMRHAGVKEKDMYEIYTVRVTLTSPLAISDMKFYNYINSEVGTTHRTCKARNAKRKCVRYEDIVIRVGVVVRFNPKDMTKGIVEGCLNEFTIPNPYFIPVKPSATNPPVAPAPVITPKPCDTTIQVEDIIEDGKKIGEKRWNDCGFKEINITRLKTEYINPCPSDIDIKGTTSKMSRFLGGLVEAGASAGVSALGSWARGASGRDIGWNAGIGFGTQRILHAFNPSEDGVHLVIRSLGVDVKVNKGNDEPNLGEGVGLRWVGDKAKVYRTLNEKSFNCETEALKKGRNMGVSTSGKAKERIIPTPTPNSRSKTTPTTGSPDPIRVGTDPINGSCVPGNTPTPCTVNNPIGTRVVLPGYTTTVPATAPGSTGNPNTGGGGRPNLFTAQPQSTGTTNNSSASSAPAASSSNMAPPPGYKWKESNGTMKLVKIL